MLTRRLIRPILALFAASLLHTACVQAQDQTKTITVTGTGTVQAIPDAFSVTVTLEERGEVVGKLNLAMKNRMDQIVAFLLKQGIEAKHIQSMMVNVYPWYENSPQGRQQSGVILSRQVKIQGQNIEEYDTILDGLLSRGIQRIDQFEFVHSNQYEINNQSLIAAIADAKAKAELMALQLDQDITGVVSINHENYAAPMRHASARVMADGFESSLPGTLNFGASVRVIFSIQAKSEK